MSSSVSSSSTESTTATSISSSSSTSYRGKGSSVIGTIVSAPIRGYYYPGRVKAIKKTIMNSSTTNDTSSCSSTSSYSSSNGQSLIYSIQFSNPLDSSPSELDNFLLNDNNEQDQGLILDYSGDQLIGRGFEPITRALLSKNQKVFITYRSRECSAHVIEHQTDSDDVILAIDQAPHNTSSTPSNANQTSNDVASAALTDTIRVRLQDVRLLPSRKSGRIQEHPDYSLLANGGRRSPPPSTTSANNVEENNGSQSNNSSSPSATSTLSQNAKTSLFLINNHKSSATTIPNGQRGRHRSHNSLLANNNNNNSNYSSSLLNESFLSSSSFSSSSSTSIMINNNCNSFQRSSSTNHIDVPTTILSAPVSSTSTSLIPGRKRRTQQQQQQQQQQPQLTTDVTSLINNHYNNGGSFNNGSSDMVMDECTAALVLMSLSASPRSPMINERTSTTKIFKCTWPSCSHKTLLLDEIENHVRVEHLRKQKDDEEMMSGEEEFYYTEMDDCSSWQTNVGSYTMATNNINGHHNSSSGPESPISLSENDGASSSSSSLMAIGDNSMDSSSNPPSPITTSNQQSHPHHHHHPHLMGLHGNNAFSPVSAFIPVQNPLRHLEDHEYNRKPDPAGVSILGGTGTVVNRRGRKPTNNAMSAAVTTATTLIQSHPINIPSMDNNNQNNMNQNHISQSPITSPFGGGGFHSPSSSLSSGFGSYNSSSSFSPVLSPTRSHSGSLSSSVGNNKHAKISGRNGNNSSSSLSSSYSSTSTNGVGGSAFIVHRTSPTKRVRGETRKCRKVYGMDRRDSWCTQCKWKKACTRFTD